MKCALCCVLLVAASLPGARAANSNWLDWVGPLITPAQKQAWLSAAPAERENIESGFWADKSIAVDEYYRRVEYIDSRFGSGRRGSGANTDQGRVWLSLGAPARVARIPSSRVFVPLEIWYYDSVPGLLNTELRLIFYQKNGLGLPMLYSPVLDTIRALLLPQSTTRSMFGPNDSVTETDIRQKLRTGPGEDEIVSAAAGVATGIKYSGNEEILGQIASPRQMLTRGVATTVTSRVFFSRPPLDIVTAPSAYGGAQVDLRLEITARDAINLEVIEDESQTSIYRNDLGLRFSKPDSVIYAHRLDLLPGSYRLTFTIDGKPYPYTLKVPRQIEMGEIRRAEATATGDRITPFLLDGKHLLLNDEGPLALVTLGHPDKVTWMLRKGSQVIWRNVSEGADAAVIELPSGIAPGSYRLEAITATDSRAADVVVKAGDLSSPKAALLSFNANLAPARRRAFIGHQYLLQGNFEAARQSLRQSLEEGVTEEAQIEFARADALTGKLDEARDRVRQVLAAHPDNFEALAVFAYVEVRLQDYQAAVELYRRALAVQDSPPLRAALAKLLVQ